MTGTRRTMFAWAKRRARPVLADDGGVAATRHARANPAVRDAETLYTSRVDHLSFIIFSASSVPPQH